MSPLHGHLSKYSGCLQIKTGANHLKFQLFTIKYVIATRNDRSLSQFHRTITATSFCLQTMKRINSFKINGLKSANSAKEIHSFSKNSERNSSFLLKEDFSAIHPREIHKSMKRSSKLLNNFGEIEPPDFWSHPAQRTFSQSNYCRTQKPSKKKPSALILTPIFHITEEVSIRFPAVSANSRETSSWVSEPHPQINIEWD